MNICSVSDCDRGKIAKGYCQMHYVRSKNGRDPSIAIPRGTRHGYRKTKDYGIWRSIKDRCNNPRTPAYKNYGGRGISVSSEFLDPSVFIMYIRSLEGYGVEGLSLDRIDNDKGYQRGNLRWATRAQQSHNQRFRNNNSSGHRGVFHNKKRNTFMAHIRVNGRLITKTYHNIEDAIKERSRMEEEYYGRS